MADFPLSQLAALKAELTNDPKAMGFNGPPALSDVAAAAKLNQVGASTDTLPVDGPLDAYLVVNAIDATEWTALTSAEKQRLQTITGAGRVDTNNANVRAAFQAMFSAGATRTALLALATRSCSRAEKLFGSGVIVQPWDVGRARAS